MKWYQLSTTAVITETGSSAQGLSDTDVRERLDVHGYNQLAEKKAKPVWLKFLGQFTDFMILILMVAAVVSGIVGETADAIIIVIIVVLNAIVGFVQEYRAEKAMEALKKMAAQQTQVIRNGELHVVDSIELVPGDLVVLEAGNSVPADLRLLEVQSLKLMEASLTGESVATDKTTAALDEDDLPLGDRSNMCYKGTQVTNGRGKGVVVATGMKTEIGRIAAMLQEKDVATPLQNRMNDFGKKLSYIILLICGLLFLVGLWRGEAPMQMLLVSISLAVAAIPEALPALITVALSRGAKRLVQQNALIRKLTAVETLGSVTYICTDKTGTLTQNKMMVVQVEAADTDVHPVGDVSILAVAMSLNHDVQRKAETYIGDPTEVAMLEYIDREHTELRTSVKEALPRVAELPFDADRKCMTTIHSYGEQYLVLCKGAVETITDRMAQQEDVDAILSTATDMAAEGVRVLAFGYRLMDQLPKPLDDEAIETSLRFAGLAGMMDPPREEAARAIAEARRAGIHPVMITGDHKATAAAIARQIGLMHEDELVITGRDMAKMSEQELDEKVERIRVYARVSPEQKLNIVKSLQRQQHFVAMTGDGVNDAPSLKKANIGIAMGITGTDVSKEAAHMILLDDNFATIVKAVKEGRRIYDNIRKFVKYIMTCNSAEIWTIFLAPIIGLPIPLLPVHILWINLVTDGLPGLALSVEKAEHNIMRRPPRKPGESLFAEGIGVHIAWVGILMAALTLGVQAWSIGVDNPHWQTMVFTVLAFAQLAHVMAIRSDYEFIYQKGLFSNKAIVASVLITFLLQLAVIYLPVGQRFFKTAPLTFVELMICIGVSAVLFHAVELEKYIRRRGRHSRSAPDV